MRLILLIIPILACITACKKPKVKQIDTNNSADSLTYQPKVTGSQWVYSRTIPILGTNNYTVTRLGYDSILHGNSYYVFGSTADANQYTRQDGNKYYNILVASTNKPALLVLDADRNVGDTWVGGVNGTDTYTFTLKQKIPQYFLDGFTFKDVIVVQQVRTNTQGNTTLNVDTYYARGVGMVLSTGTVSGIAVQIKLLSVTLL